MNLLIAGSGKMGTDIFQYLMPFGFNIIWLCENETEKEKAQQNFYKKLKRQLHSGLISQHEFDCSVQSIKITSDLSDSKSCELVIEAIAENEELKCNWFLDLHKVINSNAIITTNTSSIEIKKLIPAPERKTFFTGLHFFYPVKLRNIVEINASIDFNEANLKIVKSFLDRIEKKYITLKPANHFLLNRIFLPAQHEAFLLLQSGKADAAQIDSWLQKDLFPNGIFGFFDHVGIDVMAASIRNYANYDSMGRDYSGLINYLEEMVSKGKTGIKSSEGFYQYPLKSSTAGNISLPQETEEKINRIKAVFYETLIHCLKQEVLSPNELEYAINEYLGTDLDLSMENLMSNC
jgi:3-hydroxybutyryl-CoA dehydrogenase